MMNVSITRIPLKWPASSLCWLEDTLVDWVRGGIVYQMDGTSTDPRFSWSYRFDAAVQSPSGNHAVIYERLGTKALLIQGKKLIRELNRSFYHAYTYEYPIAFGATPDGKDILVHCPEEYCRLEIEEVETGKRLTTHDGRNPSDFFHSRLSVSPGGRWLSSTGWVWHPFGLIATYDLAGVLADPTLLDRSDVPGLAFAGELDMAAFADPDRLIIASGPDADDQNDDVASLKSGAMGVWNIATRTLEGQCPFAGISGVIMPVGVDHVVTFYQHPKLVDLKSGSIVQEWPDISTGAQDSCIMRHIPAPPPMALDAEHKRFAVASAQEIVVVELR